MKTIYKIFLYLILTICFSANLLADYKPTQAEESVVRVMSSTGHGTGFFINKDGYIITNAHVVRGTNGFEKNFVVLQNYKKKTYMYKATLIGTPSSGKDLAILKVNGKTAVPLAIARSEPEKNSTVFAIGFPGFNDDYTTARNVINEIERKMRDADDNVVLSEEVKSFAEPAIQEGKIEKIIYLNDWGLNDNAKVKTIQHNAPIRGGNSGGPLLNEKGDFVGVNTAGRTQASNRIEAQLSVSSHYEVLVEYLKENNISFNYASIISVMDILYVVLVVLVLCLIAVFFKKNTKNSSTTKKFNYIPPVSANNVSNIQPAPPAILVKLEFLDENAQKHNFSIDEKYLRESNNYIILGKSKEFCDIYIDNASISKQHLGLRYASGQIYITDRNSTNSVFVDGNKIPPFRSLKINNQSVIKIARLTGKIMCM